MNLKFKPETIRKHRRDWIKAMRSGEYKRTTSYLAKARKSDGAPTAFCCLGLACHIAKVPSILSTRKTDHGRHFLEYGEQKSEGYLPVEGQDWLGVNCEDPRLNWPEGHAMYGRTLADLNDRGWTFAQIADALEKYGIHPSDDNLAQS